MESITINKPDDMHIHLRQGEALPGYIRTAAKHFARAIVMPNTIPPIATVESILEYKKQIMREAPALTPLMTFKITELMSPDTVAALGRAGAVAGKYYSRGSTTNAEDGVKDLNAIHPVLESMEQLNLVLCVHAEEPSDPVLEREKLFLSQIEGIEKKYPSLRVILEHVSCKEAVDFVNNMPETFAATVTPHHLLLTIDNLMGEKLNPHLFCKPVLKTEEDRSAIQEAVLGGNGRFFFGSDSAPHPISAKECASPAAGIYSAPTAMFLLIEFFEKAGALMRLDNFTGGFGAAFYELDKNSEKVTYVKNPWEVPGLIDGVVPLYADKTLQWRLESDA